jgi:hypothetical protein
MDIRMSSTIVAAILLILAFVILVATSIADALKAKRAIKRRVEESWGKDPSARYKEEELQSISSYFSNRKNEQKSAFTIDDVTWHDLDMDEVFIRLNNTVSTPGEETLYKLLREPCFEPELLTRRQRLIKFFQSHRSDRVAVQTILARLSYTKGCNASAWRHTATRTRHLCLSGRRMAKSNVQAPAHWLAHGTRTADAPDASYRSYY